ncbi:hypothetical protein LCGC14_1271720 [marine sediment metagenome]|uniref:F5/8 type C domain-containing protein n=1 Tax=marine sediment metagenome TaxID=412755 RepID=A0A0F9NEI8_9ZZZZ
MSLFIDSHSIVVAADRDTFDPRIGVHSLLREADAAVSVSAETTGGEKENGYAEGFTFDFWRPGTSGTHWLRVSMSNGAKVSNYVAIAAHNLHQHAGTVKMQHSTDGGATWSDSSSEFMPADSSPLMILYDDTFAADHRLLIVSTGAVSIGVVHFGQILKLNAPLLGPWSPPNLSRLNRYVNEVADGGAFLGKSLLAEGAQLSLQISAVDMDWIRNEWEDTVRLLELRGFFFAARDLAAIGGVAAPEVFYGWTESQPSAQYDSNVYGGISLKARGIVT